MVTTRDTSTIYVEQQASKGGIPCKPRACKKQHKKGSFEMEQVEIRKITLASWNPECRSSAAAIDQLKKSIMEHGIVVPVILSQDWVCIDGHRRIACAKALGLQFVPAIIVGEGVDIAKLYESMNGAVRKLTGREETQVFSLGGKVSKKTEQAVMAIRTLAGEETFAQLVKKGLGARAIHDLTRQVLHYCLQDTDEATVYRGTINWLLAGNSHLARTAMKGDIPPAILSSAISNQRPIKPRWD